MVARVAKLVACNLLDVKSEVKNRPPMEICEDLSGFPW